MNIALLGAGNLATNLAFAISKTHHHIKAVWSPSGTSAQHLAAQIDGLEAIKIITDIGPDIDIVVIAVKDDAIAKVAKQVAIHAPNTLVVHTAGTIAMDVIPAKRRGVFYPMQTFSKHRIVDFSHIPVFLETARKEDMTVVTELANALSDNVRQLDGEKRKLLHLAAVFCCNFSNHCNAIAEQILEQNGIPFSVMLPLLQETMEKLNHCSPKDAQTGPAVRNDNNVINRHIQILQDMNRPQWAQLYQLLSQSIQKL